MNRRYDIFDRTPDEKQRAYEHLMRLAGDDGIIEVAVCADCGWWSVFDADLRHEGEPTGIVCFDPSKRHLITRVCIRPLSPAEVDKSLGASAPSSKEPE